MLVFRIERTRYLADTLSGTGASFSQGNRWNGYGTRMVYTSESRALALLEVMVHLDFSEDLPTDRVLVEIEIPDSVKMHRPEVAQLPAGWNDVPAGNGSRLFGDRFVAQVDAAVMRVPSTLVPGEFNYLINPLHFDSARLRVASCAPLRMDGRLVGTRL